MKLRAKFAILVVGIVLVPFLVVSLVVVFRAVLAETSESAPSYYRGLRTLRNELGGSLTLDGSGEPAAAERLAGELARHLPGVGFVVLSSAGRVLLSTVSTAVAGENMDVADLLAHAQSEREDYQLQVEALGTAGGPQALLLFLIPRNPELRRVSLPLLPGLPLVRGLNLGMYAMGALLLFATVGSVLIVRSLTRSITRLETATRRIAEGDLSFELTTRGRDEVASLTRSFEGMRLALREELGRRSRFLMGVSHDLKTPLALIQGYVEAIADGYADGEPQALDRYLSIIREKSKSLEGMVDSLIDFARMETGEWKLTHRTVPAPDFFRDLCLRFAEDALLLHRKLEYRLDIPPTAMMTLDETLVTRALENLVGNALRYTDPGGRIDITAAATLGDHLLRLTIRDTGVGIPGDELDRIFDPFYRGSGSRREEGHGLGLAVVKWVIESHGWTIQVRSEPARGTEFIVTLPFASGEAA